MSKKPSKKSWTDKVKERLFSPILSQGEEIEEVKKDKESQISEAYFRGKWENQQDGAKWAFFKSKNEGITEKSEIPVEEDLDTVELESMNSGDLGKISEDKKTPSRIEGIVSITDLGRASSDSRYTRSPIKEVTKKSESFPTTPLGKEFTKKSESLSAAPSGKKMEKKLAYKEMTSPIKSKTQTTPLPKNPPQQDKFGEEASLLSSIKEKSATLVEESRKWNYFRKSQKDSGFTTYKEKTREPYDDIEKKSDIPDIPLNKSEFISEEEKTQKDNKIKTLPEKPEKTRETSIIQDTHQPYTQTSKPVSPSKPSSAFTGKTGTEEEFTSLYPGLYGAETPQSPQGFVDYQAQDMVYPQGYPSSGYPQGYPPPGDTGYPQGYPPPGDTGYPQGYPPPGDTGYPQGYPPPMGYPQGYPPPMGYPQGYPPPMGYPQGYQSSMGYPQGYPPPMGYPQGYPPPMGYPQGYQSSMGYQNVQVEVFMIQQILNYLLQSGIFTQLQGFLSQTDLPSSKNEVVIGEVVKKVLEEVKKQNPVGTMTQDQEHFIQNKLAGTIAALNIKKSDTNTLEINSGDLKIKQPDMSGQISPELYAAPQTSYLGAKGTTPLDILSFSQITSNLNLPQAPSTTPLAHLYSQSTTPLSLSQAPSTTPLAHLYSQSTTPLSLSQAPSTTPLSLSQAPSTTPLSLSQAPSTSPLSLSQAPSTTPLSLSQAPSTAPLVMPKANITSQLDLFKYLYKEEEKPEECIKEKKEEKEEKYNKDIYARILKTSVGEETEEVVEEVEDWFKKKGLKQEDYSNGKYKRETEKATYDDNLSVISSDQEEKKTAPLILPVREEKKTAPLILPVREEKKTAPLILPVREEKSEVLEDWENEITLSTDWEIDQSGDDMGWMEIFDTVELKEEKLEEKKVAPAAKDESLDLLKTLAKCEKLLKSSPSKPKKALTLCKRLLNVYPGNPLVYHMASEAYDKLGNSEKADKYRKKADNLDM
jgi:tetratricopeptide (TPR) repeat protein